MTGFKNFQRRFRWFRVSSPAPFSAEIHPFLNGFSPRTTSESSVLISQITPTRRDKSLWLKKAVLRSTNPSSEIFASIHQELERQRSSPDSPAPPYSKSPA